MSEPVSITAQVAQLIEVISENISGLMLVIIVCQERNIAPMEQFPAQVQMVKQSGEILHAVAMEVSNEYAKYPDIQQEIQEAAQSVLQSTVELNSALNTLMTSPDRRAGWNGLVKAVKNMSSKTIRLLQIVYGAERERIYRIAQEALDALNNVGLQGVANDQGRKFADQVFNAAKNADQLAAYVRGKAEEALPQKKKELNDLANLLNNGSQQLRNDGNKLIRDPNNPNLQRVVADDLAQVRGTIDKTIAALRDMDGLDNVDKDFDARTAEMKRSLKDLEAGGLDSFDKDILFTAKKERQEMDNLLDDIDNHDPLAAKQSLDNAKLQNERLMQLANMESNNSQNPALRQALQAARGDLESAFPNYERAAMLAMKNPNDDRYLNDLDNAHDRLDAAIQRLCDAVSNPNAEIAAAAQKELEDLDQLRDAGNRSDAPGVSRAAKDAVKENKILAGLCASQAGKTANPLRKKQILDAVDELQRLLPHEILAAKEALQNPSPQNLQKLGDKTNTMQDQVRATALLATTYPQTELLDAARKEKNLLDALQRDAEAGNPRGVDQTAPQLQQNTKLIGDLAREIAKGKDRAQQARILDSVNKLERMAAPTIQDAKALAQNPNNPQAKQALARKVDEMKALVDKIVADTDAELFAACLAQQGNLHNVKNSSDEGDLSGLADATQKVAGLQERIIPLALAAANRADPNRARQLQQDVDELKRLLPREVGQTNAVLQDPDNRDKKMALRDTTKLMEDIVAGIGDPSRYNANLPRGGQGEGNDLKRMMNELVAAAERYNRNPNDQAAKRRLQEILENLPLDLLNTDQEKLANLIRQQCQALDRLTNAAENGDKPGVARAGQDMTALQKQIRDQASKMADNLLDPDRREKVYECLDNLDRMVPGVIQAANQVANNPRDQLAKQRMYNQADDIRDQLGLLAGHAIGTPDMRLKDAADREKEALERLRTAVRTGNRPDCEAALGDVKRYNDILSHECREVAKSIPDPNLNKRILDNVTALEKLMPILGNDCRKGAANPRDAQAQGVAMGDIKRCEDLINALLNDTSSDPIALAQLEDLLLTDLENHVKTGNPAANKDKQKVQQTQAALNDAANLAAQRLPPRGQQSISNALNELNNLLPQHEQQCGETSRDRNNVQLQDKLHNSTTKMRAPLAQIIATLRPTPENIADANRKREEALLARLREAAARGDKQETERLLPEIKGFNDRLVNQARAEAPKCSPENAAILNAAADELEQLHARLPDIARNAANNPNNPQAQAELAVHTKKMENAMDRIVEALRDKQGSNADKARRLANALLRGLNTGMDPSKFLQGAKALAAFIDGLNLDANYDLDAELAKLNKLAQSSQPLGRKKVPQDLDGLVQGLKNIKPQKPVTPAPPPPAPEPKTFDERIAAVAADVDRHVMLSDLGPGDPITILIRAIAADLKKLADSAKAGQRQNMIQASRDACAKITELQRLLDDYARRCKDPVVQDRLLRAMQATKSFSTQMKILTAVKAAGGGDDDADTEDQLVSVTAAMGKALNESVSSVQVMRGGRLLR